jgi:hypothetical protein
MDPRLSQLGKLSMPRHYFGRLPRLWRIANTNVGTWQYKTSQCGGQHNRGRIFAPGKQEKHGRPPRQHHVRPDYGNMFCGITSLCDIRHPSRQSSAETGVGIQKYLENFNSSLYGESNQILFSLFYFSSVQFSSF